MKNNLNKQKEDKKKIGLYLPIKLLEAIKKKAKEEDRSLNYTLVKLLQNSVN